MSRVVIFALIATLTSIPAKPLYAQENPLSKENIQSIYHITSGKLLYQRFGNYDQAEDHFQKAIHLRKHNQEAYYQLGMLYYERSLKETKSDLRLLYQRKAVDSWGRFLTSVNPQKDKKYIAQYYQVKGMKDPLESSIRQQTVQVIEGPPTYQFPRSSSSSSERESKRFSLGERFSLSDTEFGKNAKKFWKDYSKTYVKGSQKLRAYERNVRQNQGGSRREPVFQGVFDEQGNPLPKIEMTTKEYLASPYAKHSYSSPDEIPSGEYRLTTFPNPSPASVNFTERGTVEVYYDPREGNLTTYVKTEDHPG